MLLGAVLLHSPRASVRLTACAPPPPRPQFIRTYNIHFGSSYNAFRASAPEPDCLFILHLKHLLGSRADAPGGAANMSSA